MTTVFDTIASGSDDLDCTRLRSLARLRDRVHREVDPLIPCGSAVALVDFPNHPNIGDSAIWTGELEYLDAIDARIAYTCDCRTYDPRQLAADCPEGPILFHGGGNFGSLWPHHHALKLRIAADFPDRTIVQLPQTIWFETAESVTPTKRTFSHRRNFHLLVRDSESLERAWSWLDLEARLCPDMAFMISARPRVRPSVDVHVLLRADKESSAGALRVEALAGLKASVADWPRRRPTVTQLALLCAAKARVANVPVAGRLFRQVRGAIWNRQARARVEEGFAIIGCGKALVCDRLHAHILATLAGVPHVFVDNSYGKLSSFRTAWTTDIETALFATDLDEAVKRVRAML